MESNPRANAGSKDPRDPTGESGAKGVLTRAASQKQPKMDEDRTLNPDDTDVNPEVKRVEPVVQEAGKGQTGEQPSAPAEKVPPANGSGSEVSEPVLAGSNSGRPGLLGKQNEVVPGTVDKEGSEWSEDDEEEEDETQGSPELSQINSLGYLYSPPKGGVIYKPTSEEGWLAPIDPHKMIMPSASVSPYWIRAIDNRMKEKDQRAKKMGEFVHYVEGMNKYLGNDIPSEGLEPLNESSILDQGMGGSFSDPEQSARAYTMGTRELNVKKNSVTWTRPDQRRGGATMMGPATPPSQPADFTGKALDNFQTTESTNILGGLGRIETGSHQPGAVPPKKVTFPETGLMEAVHELANDWDEEAVKAQEKELVQAQLWMVSGKAAVLQEATIERRAKLAMQEKEEWRALGIDLNSLNSDECMNKLKQQIALEARKLQQERLCEAKALAQQFRNLEAQAGTLTTDSNEDLKKAQGQIHQQGKKLCAKFSC